MWPLWWFCNALASGHALRKPSLLAYSLSTHHQLAHLPLA